ncbi:MAG: hypothetical protein R6U04_13965 [Bacteroidales bacterium]
MRQLLLLSIAMLLAFSSCDFFRSKNLFSNADESLLQEKRKDSLKYVDSIRTLHNEIEHLRQAHNRLLDSIEGEKVGKKTTTSTSGNKYHIIVGGFRNQEYLNSYNEYIQDRGFRTNILQNDYGFKLISIDSYSNWNSAARTLKDIQEDLEDSAWIYIQS